jgi:hypothetical protein
MATGGRCMAMAMEMDENRGDTLNISAAPRGDIRDAQLNDSDILLLSSDQLIVPLELLHEIPSSVLERCLNNILLKPSHVPFKQRSKLREVLSRREMMDSLAAQIDDLSLDNIDCDTTTTTASNKCESKPVEMPRHLWKIRECSLIIGRGNSRSKRSTKTPLNPGSRNRVAQ